MQGLLAQVQSGKLRLVDGGDKIRRKIESIEAALEDYDKRSSSKRIQQQEQRSEYSQKPGANLPAETGSSSLSPVDHTVPESIRGVQSSADSASVMQIDEEPDQTGGSERNDTGKCEAGPTSSISETSQSSQRDSDNLQPGKEEKEDWVAKRDKLRRKSETTSASPRTIVGNGKSVRLRSGLLEPAHERLPGEVVRETAERMREQIVKQVDITADRLGQLLTIEEGGPMDTVSAPLTSSVQHSCVKKDVRNFSRKLCLQILCLLALSDGWGSLKGQVLKDPESFKCKLLFVIVFACVWVSQ